MKTYKEKLNDITTLIFDIDGVFTNGDITIGAGNEVLRSLNAKDGYAVQLAAKMGFNVFIITGGTSESLEKTMIGLGVKEIHTASQNKLAVYEKLKLKYNLEDKEILYMGDDIPDYEVMQRVGCATCPQDAVSEIKSISDYQSPFGGGKLAVRDIIEQVLRVQEKWMTKEAFQW